jgi:protein-disulfide isomerase
MARLLRRSVLAAAALALGAGRAALAAPAAAPAEMSLGNPKAKVQVVEYASLSCSHCAAFNAEVFPAFKKKYVDTGRVRYTLREFLTQPANVAAAGFLTARCAGPAKYFSVVDGVFRSQAEWGAGDVKPSLLKVARANGLTEAQFEACLKDQAALDALVARVQKAQQDGITATPTFVINGRKVKEGVMTLPELDAAIAAAGQPTGRR